MADPFSKGKKEKEEVKEEEKEEVTTVNKDHISILDQFSFKEITTYLKQRVKADVHNLCLDKAEELYKELMKRDEAFVEEVLRKAFSDKIEQLIHAAKGKDK